MMNTGLFVTRTEYNIPLRSRGTGYRSNRRDSPLNRRGVDIVGGFDSVDRCRQVRCGQYGLLRLRICRKDTVEFFG